MLFDSMNMYHFAVAPCNLKIFIDMSCHILQYKCGDGDIWFDKETAASPVTGIVYLTGSTFYTCYVRVKNSSEKPLSLDTYTSCSGYTFLYMHVELQVNMIKILVLPLIKRIKFSRRFFSMLSCEPNYLSIRK